MPSNIHEAPECFDLRRVPELGIKICTYYLGEEAPREELDRVASPKAIKRIKTKFQNEE